MENGIFAACNRRMAAFHRPRPKRPRTKKAEHITVPVLVMHSSFTRGRMRLDSGVSERGCVSTRNELQKRGMKLGQKSTRQVSTITDGMHDLILSEPASRESAYDTIFRFIRAH